MGRAPRTTLNIDQLHGRRYYGAQATGQRAGLHSISTLKRSEPPRPIHVRSETRGGQRVFVYSIKNTDRDKVATHQVVQHCKEYH